MVMAPDNSDQSKIHVTYSRRIEMPPDFMFPEGEAPPSDLINRRRLSAQDDLSQQQVSCT